MNYKEEDKNIIENARYRYYCFTEKDIEEIVGKNINEVDSEEWRMLIQMLYPRNMIGSGLFQPILIFNINKDGKRIDPPIEAYNGVDDLKDNDCLLFRIINYIKNHSEFEINDSWHKAKEKILKEGESK